MSDIKVFRDRITSKESLAEIDKIWHGNSNQFVRAFMTYQRIQDSRSYGRKIQDCTPASIADCMILAAQLQLFPSTSLGLVHFIPFKDTCTIIVGYQGMIDIALRDKRITHIDPRLVKEGEECIVKGGTSPSIEHTIDPFSDAPITGGYAIATFENGKTQFITMSKKEIDDIRAKSDKSKGEKGSSFWNNHYNEMAKKTLIRRLFKLLPKPAPSSENRVAYEKMIEMDNKEYEGRTIDNEEKPGSPEQIMEILENE